MIMDGLVHEIRDASVFQSSPLIPFLPFSFSPTVTDRTDENASEEDPLVYCEKCDLGVHTECYGNPLGMDDHSLAIPSTPHLSFASRVVAHGNNFSVLFDRLFSHLG